MEVKLLSAFALTKVNNNRMTSVVSACTASADIRSARKDI